MTEAGDSWRKLAKKLANEPGFQAIALLAGVAILSAAKASATSTPEKRAAFRQRMEEEARYKAEVKRTHELRSKRLGLFNAYFGEGPGKTLLSEQAKVVVGPGDPFADAVFEYLPAGFRQTRWRITSAARSLSLEASYDSADRTGGLCLTQAGTRIWGISVHTLEPNLAQYDVTDDIDVGSAQLAARLLATPECPFKTIVLYKPEFHAIKRQLWIDHMRAHPELAEELEWSEEEPLG
jgi:hypothetical protein